MTTTATRHHESATTAAESLSRCCAVTRPTAMLRRSGSSQTDHRVGGDCTRSRPTRTHANHGFFGDRPIPLAGEGAPLVSEFAAMEYAAARGMSTDAGNNYLGRALELRYRLPKLWDRVIGGKLPVWRAGRIADHTRSLPLEGAAHVDRYLAPVAHSCSWAQLERTVEEAMVRFDPDSRRGQAPGGGRGAPRRCPPRPGLLRRHRPDRRRGSTWPTLCDLEERTPRRREAASRPRGRPSPSTSAAPSPSATWPAVSWPSGSMTDQSPARARWTLVVHLVRRSQSAGASNTRSPI